MLAGLPRPGKRPQVCVVPAQPSPNDVIPPGGCVRANSVIVQTTEADVPVRLDRC